MRSTVDGAFASFQSRDEAQVVIHNKKPTEYIHEISYWLVAVTAASTLQLETGQGDPRLDEYR